MHESFRRSLVLTIAGVACVTGCGDVLQNTIDPKGTNERANQQYAAFERRPVNVNPNDPRATCLPGSVMERGGLRGPAVDGAIVVTDADKNGTGPRETYRLTPNTSGAFTVCFRRYHVKVQAFHKGLLRDQTEFRSDAAPSRIDLFIDP